MQIPGPSRASQFVRCVLHWIRDPTWQAGASLACCEEPPLNFYLPNIKEGAHLKLATLQNGTIDGELVVVTKDLRRAVSAAKISPCLLRALEAWDEVLPALEYLSTRLNEGTVAEAFAFDPSRAAAPLPRAPQWLDGSAFPTHGQRMVKAFGLSTKTLGLSYPLMYQGCSDNFLGACATMPIPDESYGIDIEGELVVITSAVPMGTAAAAANQRIRLLALVNDVSLRNLLFTEMSMGFGMIHCKPTSVFSPVCVTPDELDVLKPGHFEMTMHVQLNGETLGRLRSDEMEFSFGDLIAHAARTRSLAAGTIIGSGTFSNTDESRGCACVAEKRALEQMKLGSIQTDWLRFRDRVRIEAFDSRGASIFGAIDHTFAQAENGDHAAH